MMLIQELTTYCTLFQGMQPETVKDLLDRYGYALRSYPEQSFLAMQGEMCRLLFILCHGHINALMINHEGRQIIVEQFTDWSVLAPAFLLATHNVFPVNIETTSPCEVLVLNKDTLLKMLHADLRMMENFLREISDKCAVLTGRLHSFALKSLREQLLQYLHTREHYGKQQEIADRLGVARPSLNRVLQELCHEGIVKLEHGKITLLKRSLPKSDS